MKQRLFIFLGFIFLIVLLIGLNAVSYVQKEEFPDTELTANRSTYNAGATGTRAFYDFLAETGRKVSRWRQPPSDLLKYEKDAPATLVTIGSLRREIDNAEATDLMRWVRFGGRLIIIDRDPPADLLATTADWQITAVPENNPETVNADSSNQTEMIGKTVAAKPTQPTVYTQKINAVQPSRFASTVELRYVPYEENRTSDERAKGDFKINPPESSTKNGSGSEEDNDEIYSAELPAEDAQKDETLPKFLAPVVHLANNEKILLVDFPFGNGQIIYLTDPYIVANGGINFADNLKLAVNVVAAREGIIAFDEYHHGYGMNENRLFAYFSGTPVAAVFLQFLALVAFLLFSQSRRFARSLPAAEPNRLSKLEYVGAMAELQRRIRGYDIALENIYGDFRRRAARLVGLDNRTMTRQNLARLLAERLGEPAAEIDKLLADCEAVAQGERTNKNKTLQLVKSLRELEKRLRLRRGRI